MSMPVCLSSRNVEIGSILALTLVWGPILIFIHDQKTQNDRLILTEKPIKLNANAPCALRFQGRGQWSW